MIGATPWFDGIARLLRSIEMSDREGSRLDLDEACTAIVDCFLDARQRSAAVFLVGNGGSASIAGHMEMDLCNRLGARALVFNDPPVLTALANDLGYEQAFEKMVRLWTKPRDVLVAISSSGRSPNILRAVTAGLDCGATLVTFSGFAIDNPLRGLGHINAYVASSNYGEVEVAHHALGHFLTDSAADRSSQR